MVVFTALIATIIIIDGFFNISFIHTVASEVQNWGVIIAAIALGLAIVNLSRIHIKRILLKRTNWKYSIGLVVAMFVQVIIGLIYTSSSNMYDFAFSNILNPSGAILKALLALWIASAAYRSFIARTFDSTVLLISAILVMLGNAPIGQVLYSGMPDIKNWILATPNMAAQRGIMIGAGIGAIALGVRILLGIEHGHLGGGDEV